MLMRVLLLLLVLLPSLSWATAYFATSAGSDSNACTTGARCATFAKLLTLALVPGDTLNLNPGETFRGTTTHTTPVAGASGSPIILQAGGTTTRVQLTGTHNGAGNNASLIDTTVNFTTAGATTSMRVLNIDDGSSCPITSISTTTNTNDTVNCSDPLAGGKENDWDVNDRYRIDNNPVVTLASLFDSGWTNEGSNVWSHATTTDPMRQVFLNRTSTSARHFEGTCDVATLAGQADRAFCVSGGTTLFLRSSSNPATRWTRPGVEVSVQALSDITTLNMTRNFWTVQNIAVGMASKGAYNIIGASASNLTFTNVESFFSGLHYAAGSGSGGRAPMGFNGSFSNLTITGGLLRDAGRNCLTMEGTGTMSDLLIENTIMYNSFNHSCMNTGISGPGTRTNLTFRRLDMHHVCDGWDTGHTLMTYVNPIMEYGHIFAGVVSGDPRVYTTNQSCGPEATALLTWDNAIYTIRYMLIHDMERGGWIERGALAKYNHVTMYNMSQVGILLRALGSGGSLQINNSILDAIGTTAANGSLNSPISCLIQGGVCSQMSVSNLSNNNIFRNARGDTSVGFWSGDGGTLSLTGWQTKWGSDAASSQAAPNFVSAATFDFNRSAGVNDGDTVAPFNGAASDRGVYEGPLYAAGIAGNAPATATNWCMDMSALFTTIGATASAIHPRVNADTGRTATNLSFPSGARVCFDVSGTTPTGGQTLTVDLDYGAVQDAINLGNSAVFTGKLLAVTGQSITNNIAAGPTHVLRQVHFRCEGVLQSEAAELRATEDANCAVVSSGAIRLRLMIENETATAPAQAYGLQCADDAGAFYDVGDTSTGRVSLAADAGMVSLAFTTNKLTLDGDTFLASSGVFVPRGGGTYPAIAGLVVGRRFEMLYALQFASATVGQFTDCRIKGLNTYTVTPRLTISAAHGEH